LGGITFSHNNKSLHFLYNPWKCSHEFSFFHQDWITIHPLLPLWFATKSEFLN
jgi:hypothetical protein